MDTGAQIGYLITPYLHLPEETSPLKIEEPIFSFKDRLEAAQILSHMNYQNYRLGMSLV